MSELKILLIDDDHDHLHDIQVILEFIGEECLSATSENWQQACQQPEHLLAIAIGTHQHYSSLSELISEIQAVSKTLPILLTGDISYSGDLPNDLQTQIVGRIENPPRYNSLLEVLHACQECRGNRHVMEDGQKPLELFRSMIGSSQAIQDVRKLIEQVANTEANVLILGESGTGKEVAARNIHYLSERSDKPFVPVNCGAIPGDLLESELFGHEKGAFTGALSARQGRFELAQGGTLFLDEIGDMPLAMQVKLLRVLQEKCFERVGSNRTIEADVRIIAATHRNLDKEVAAGNFREDLFYRLNVFPIEMPALRERQDDVPLLINELITRLEKHDRGSVRLSAGAIASLMRHDWAGNVRELANLVERLCILFPYGVVDINDLPEKYQYGDGIQAYESPALVQHIEANESQPDETEEVSATTVESFNLPKEGLNLKEFMAKLEVDYIRQALDESSGVVAKAAQRLGMRRTTLVEKMKKYKAMLN
nr:sigma-54 dependent transcriptional regulator [Pleionea sp. CnH1-48]